MVFCYSLCYIFIADAGSKKGLRWFSVKVGRRADTLWRFVLTTFASLSVPQFPLRKQGQVCNSIFVI